MFESCFVIVENIITQCFTWCEGIFSSFGLSLIAIVTVTLVSCFLVRNFVGVFLK